MKLSDFDYNLPKELIAQYPLKEREDAKLLVLDRKDSRIEHRVFKEIASYLKKDDLLLFVGFGVGLSWGSVLYRHD